MLYFVKYKKPDGAVVTHQIESSIDNLQEASKQFRAECNSMGFTFIDCALTDDFSAIEPAAATNSDTPANDEVSKYLHADLALAIANADALKRLLDSQTANLAHMRSQLAGMRGLMARQLDWFIGQDDEAVDMAEWLDRGTALFNEARSRLVSGVE